jgi:hypothetical protein
LEPGEYTLSHILTVTHILTSLSRHFAKEDLPRISYANQNIKIDVKRKDYVDPFEPIMTVSLGEVDILVP